MTLTLQSTKPKFYARGYSDSENVKIMKIIKTLCITRKTHDFENALIFIADKIGRSPKGVKAQFYKLQNARKSIGIPALKLPRNPYKLVSVPVVQATIPKAVAPKKVNFRSTTKVSTSQRKAVKTPTQPSLFNSEYHVVHLKGVKSFTMYSNNSCTIICLKE